MARTRPLTTLSIGGATYDLFVPVKEPLDGDVLALKSGRKIPIKDMLETVGGGAVNSSVGLSRLGFAASFAGILAMDGWGYRIAETLKRERVNCSSATLVENETSGFSLILLLENGERVIFNHAGANEHLHDVTFDKGAILTVDAVYLNRLSESACIIENDILAAFRKKPGMHVTWNPGGCQLDEGMESSDKQSLLKQTTVLLLNKEEAEKFTRIGDTKRSMLELIKHGVKYVVVTDGGNGAIGTDGKEFVHCKAEAVNNVDATGAGDAFGVGMTWAILHGETLPKALKAGTLNAVSVLGAIGAHTGLLTDKEMREELERFPVKIETTPC